jgi:hypothetical protein
LSRSSLNCRLAVLAALFGIVTFTSAAALDGVNQDGR